MAATIRAPAAAEAGPAPAVIGLRERSALLLAALVAAVTYAAFSDGAARYPQLSWLAAGLVAATLGALVSWAGSGAVRWGASRTAAVGLGLLVALAAWSALTLLWSITPDRSWLEANRAIAYALAVGLALALGASHPRAIERTTVALLGSAVLVAAYAFATKVLPGVRVPGLLDLDQGDGLARLRAPLGYWNADALVCALALPIAIRLACDLSRRRWERGLALAAALLLVCVVGLTYSRGAVLAVATAAAVMTVLGGARLRGLAVLAGLVLAAAPALAVAWTRPGTSDNFAPIAGREHDGLVLLAVFAGCLVLLGVLALGFWRLEQRVAWSAERTRGVFRVAATLAALAVLVTVTAAAVSHRGLPGTVSDRVEAFTRPSADDQYDPSRLVTTTSGNRWTWWREAVGAWSDRPVAGWGAGSFRATHLRYRVDELPVTQAHSVPLQFLAETGIVGLLLYLGAFGALGLAALRRVRSLVPGRERDLAVAGLAAVAAWLVHGLYDWDWNLPGATLPALVLLGVLAAAPRGRRAPVRAGFPVLAVVAGALVLSLVAASVVLPGWADSKASGAQVAVRPGADDASLAQAAADADLAARLDPTSIRPLLASATIARRRGRLLDARAFLLDAVRRQPDSVDAWTNLAGAAFQLADRAGFERAALRALALDPHSSGVRQLALAAVAFRAPPGASATAVGTPLTPSAVPAAPLPVAPATPPAGTTGATGPAVAAGATGPSGPTGPPPAG